MQLPFKSVLLEKEILKFTECRCFLSSFNFSFSVSSRQYHKTIEAVSSVENSVEILLDLLQRYREKAGDKVGDKGSSIFTKACFLLALLLQDRHRALVCTAHLRVKYLLLFFFFFKKTHHPNFTFCFRRS